MLICTPYFTVMRRKTRFFHAASGNQECLHLKKKNQTVSLKAVAANAYRTQQHSNTYFVAYLVLKTKCEKPQVPSCLNPPSHVIDTWYSERPEQSITKWSWRGSSLQDMFIRPEISYSYQVREPTSDTLI